MKTVRQWAALFARTPLHPQWLLGRRRVPDGLSKAEGSVLDIGSADRWIEQFIPANATYIALDYPMTGRDLYGARPDVFADAVHLPFRNDQFDGVVCLEVLEHVADAPKVVTEIARVLRPGGRAWISMPFLYPLHDLPFDYQRYTEFGLRRDMERAGLEVLTLRKTHHAIRSAGLLMCLAISGGIAAQRRAFMFLLLPFALLTVLVINVFSWVLSKVWPDWRNISTGFEIEVLKR